MRTQRLLEEVRLNEGFGLSILERFIFELSEEVKLDEGAIGIIVNSAYSINESVEAENFGTLVVNNLIDGGYSITEEVASMIEELWDRIKSGAKKVGAAIKKHSGTIKKAGAIGLLGLTAACSGGGGGSCKPESLGRGRITNDRDLDRPAAHKVVKAEKPKPGKQITNPRDL